MPSPPTSALFPYPTLFRPEPGPGGEGGGQPLPQGERLAVGRLRFRQPARAGEQDAQGVVACGQVLAEVGPGGNVGGQPLPQGEDRKSTRLNSSHLGISYAVSAHICPLSLPDALPT